MVDTVEKEKPGVVLPSYGRVKKAAKLGMPLSILIYGPPKRGKTVFAASIVDVPGIDRVLVIDVEGGSASLNDWYPDVDVVVAGTADAFNDVANDVLSGDLVEEESGLPYQVVIIDTLDKAQARQLAVYSKDPRSKKDGFWRWAMIKTWTEKVTDLFHMAEFTTIFVAHQDEDKETGTTTVLLDGKSKLTFPATPDIIGHFTVKTVEEDGVKSARRVVDFSLTERFITGQRYADRLNGTIIDPTMEKIFKKIQPDLYKEKASKKTTEGDK